MSVLQIFLFGNVRIVPEGWSSEVKATHTVQALLAYLLLHRHRYHSREVLANLFWGNKSEDRARRCLSTSLWRLRRALEPPGTSHGVYLVTTPMGEIGFNRESDYWLDVAVFEEAAGRILGQPIQRIEAANAEKLEQALSLYTAELLEGFYDDWALRERERLRLLYLNSLAHLMHYYRDRSAYEQSLACGQQILNHDPLREEIHREMMHLYLESGQRGLAIRQYKICREILAEELGIPPMEETQALYNQIVSAAGPHRLQADSIVEPFNLQRGLRQLRLALQSFDEARKRLERAIQLVEQLTKRQN
jgi:DNA-binding SARP family transcriptional activator